VGEEDAPVLASEFRFYGDLSGELLLVLPEPDTHQLHVELLPSSEGGARQEDRQSALSEVANIVASACLSAIGRSAGLTLIPSIPPTARGAWSARARRLVAHSPPAAVSLIPHFRTAAPPLVGGYLLVLPDVPSLARLIEKLGL